MKPPISTFSGAETYTFLLFSKLYLGVVSIMELCLKTLALLLSRQVIGFDVAPAAAIPRSDITTPTITKTIYYTEVRELSTNYTNQPARSVEVTSTQQLIKRDKIVHLNSKTAHKTSTDLYNLRVNLDSEGYISIYVTRNAVSGFCDGLSKQVGDTLDVQELSLAVYNATKLVDIPVRMGDAISFCRDAQDANWLKGSTSADTGPTSEMSSTQELPMTSSEEDTSELTTASQKPKISTTSASEMDSDSSSISKPSSLNPMTDILASSTDDSNDNYDSLTSAEQVLSSTTSTDVTLATPNSEMETDSNATSSSTSSDETEDASETLDSSFLPSRTSSADFASTDQVAGSVDSTTNVFDASEADESGILTESTSSKKKKTHSVTIDSDATTPQSTDDASLLEPMGPDSITDDSSYDNSNSGSDDSTPSATLAKVQGAADEPTTPSVPPLTDSSIKPWHNEVNSYMSFDISTATVDLEVVAASETIVNTDSENGAARRRTWKTVAGREANVENTSSAVSGINSWYHYVSSYMRTTGTPTQILYATNGRPTARSKPSSNAGVKRVMPPSLIRWKYKRQREEGESGNKDNTQENEDNWETPVLTRSIAKTTKTEAADPIITKTGKSKGKGKTGDIDKEKDKSEKEAEKSRSKKEKDEKEKETGNGGGNIKETGKDAEKGHPKATPGPAPKDQGQDGNPSDKNTRLAPTLPSDISFALASPPTTAHPRPTSPIPSPPPPPPENLSAPSTPIIWDPDCIPLHSSSPSNAHDKRTTKGCWRTIIAHSPQSSKAWNILSDGQNRQLVFVLWCVLIGMIVQFGIEFMGMRGGEWHIGRWVVWRVEGWRGVVRE